MNGRRMSVLMRTRRTYERTRQDIVRTVGHRLVELRPNESGVPPPGPHCLVHKLQVLRVPPAPEAGVCIPDDDRCPTGEEHVQQFGLPRLEVAGHGGCSLHGDAGSVGD